MEKQVARRNPPGDNWQLMGEVDVYDSLTAVLNAIFLKYQSTDFHVNAKDGLIMIDDGQEAPPEPPKMWDLYGEKS